MQAVEERPVAQAPAPASSEVDSRSNARLGRSLAEQKRVRQDDRGRKRFGPLPGEVFPDEARFGSFS